jgi:hypothetical protein
VSRPRIFRVCRAAYERYFRKEEPEFLPLVVNAAERQLHFAEKFQSIWFRRWFLVKVITGIIIGINSYTE